MPANLEKQTGDLIVLRLTTSLAGSNDKQLLARLPAGSEYNDTEEVRELLIRSVNQSSLKNKVFGSVCDKGRAESICRAHLSKNSQHNFFNLILGMHSISREAKVKYLETAALSTGPRSMEVSGAAAYELAGLYKKEGKYIEAQAWMVKALLNGYSSALESFLGQRVDVNFPPFAALDYKQPSGYKHPISDRQSWVDSGYALSLSTFVAVILSDNNFEFPELTETKWYAHWHNSNKGTIENAHKVNRQAALNEILTAALTAQKYENQTAVPKLLHHIISSDPVIYHDFFVYCFKAGIIPENVYEAVMRYYMMQMPEFASDKSAQSRYADMGAYTQAKYYFSRRNPDLYARNPRQYLEAVANGVKCIDSISSGFNKYNINDFADDKQIDNDLVLYRIFKSLLAKKQYGAAQQFLAKINKDKPQTAVVYDKDIFEFFRFVDMDERNIEIFELKQKILNQIMNVSDFNSPDESFLRVVVDQLEKVNDAFYQLRMNFLRVIAKLKEIQSQVQAGNANNGAQLARIIADLEKSPELLSGKKSSFKDWQSLKEKFVTSVIAQSGVGFGTANLFGEAKKLLDAISKQLIALETKANEKPKYQSIYPKLDKHPSEEEQLRWAMRDSVLPQRTLPLVPVSEAAREDEEIRLAIELSKQENYRTPAAVAVAPPPPYEQPHVYAPVYQPYQPLYVSAQPQLQPIAMPLAQNEPLPYPPPPPYNPAVQYHSVVPSAPVMEIPPPPQARDEGVLIDFSVPTPAQDAAKKQKEAEYQQFLNELMSAVPAAPSADARVSTSLFTLYGSASVAPVSASAPQVQSGITSISPGPVTQPKLN